MHPAGKENRRALRVEDDLPPATAHMGGEPRGALAAGVRGLQQLPVAVISRELQCAPKGGVDISVGGSGGLEGEREGFHQQRADIRRASSPRVHA